MSFFDILGIMGIATILAIPYIVVDLLMRGYEIGVYHRPKPKLSIISKGYSPETVEIIDRYLKGGFDR